MDEVRTASFGERITNQWSLRDEILATSHRWPLIILYFLVGSLIGYALSQVWPSPYRASAELYVGLNPYRASEDQNAVSAAGGLPFNYVDDYKNWQMANLNALVYMDETLKETLQKLREQDETWQSISREDLSSMLHVYWRNPGKWRLVAENRDRKLAAEAVSTWRDVVLEKVNSAILHSQQGMALYIQFQSNAAAQTQATTRSAALSQVRDSIQAWQTISSQWPADQPVGDAERLQLWAAMEQIGPDPQWQSLRDAFPPPGASAQAYTAWIDEASIFLDEQIKVLQAQINTLTQEQTNLQDEYMQAFAKSRGFSAELEVEPISESAPALSVVRPAAMLALIGGVLGLLMWLVVWLARITLRTRR